MASVTELHRKSFADLTSGIVDDVEELFKAELRLARHEMRHELEDAKEAATLFAIACGFLLIGAFVTAFAAAQFLHWLGLPLWGGALIVGVTCLVAGAALFAWARSKAVDLAPDRTVKSVKENVRWIKKHV